MASGTGARTRLAEYRRKRDFAKTKEPSGDERAPERPRSALRFVIQKHAASNLHFDFRLELDGVMKSWAVPKGPSMDPSVKRLAMEVEDHPISYNEFEGIIPKGQYGGGTVMLWDQGTYEPDDGGGTESLRRGYASGRLSITMHGDRLEGSFALVRTRRGEGKPQWLLIKQRDEHASGDRDIVAEEMTSVVSGRSMDEIAAGADAVWHSNREMENGDPGRGERANGKVSSTRPASSGTASRIRRPASRAATRSPRPTPQSLLPMYASIGSEVPSGEGWAFEPKYDGVRVLAWATAKRVHLMTRNGKDKAAQFPEVAEALRTLAAKRKRALVLDGEIVARGENGEGLARFQALQSRMHVKDADAIAEHSTSAPVAFIAFDIVVDGEESLLREPWSLRRRRLEQRVGKSPPAAIMLGESRQGDGDSLLRQARAEGWEGIIAKRTDARYEAGHRSPSWLKLKIEFRQEFVIGGFTEPRNTRQHLGAMLLGYFDRGRFVYVGHTGGGFTQAGLAEMSRRLKPLVRRTSPFEETPKTNEKATWVEPEVVVEVKFSEWTADGKLRQPIYLGTRDDKNAREVGREGASVQRAAKSASEGKGAATKKRAAGTPAKPKAASSGRKGLERLEEIEAEGGNGILTLPGGARLELSSLGKVFFKKDGYTKGDLMRYYATVAPMILPTIRDRPLVLRRFPNGIDGKAFYQQKAPEHPPEGVRVEPILAGDGEEQERLVGGDLATLLYIVQLGAVSVDPWHSRVQSLESADYTILDLDPGPRASFERVVDVALWVNETLDALGLHGVVKTSGSTGLHIYVPLPPRTPTQAATIVAEIIARRVATAHPKEATVERSVKARPASSVYVDYLQNILGKTVAGPYSARARPGATVSMPLDWSEVTHDLDPREFTIVTAPARLEKVGDLWGKAMKQKNSLAGMKL